MSKSQKADFIINSSTSLAVAAAVIPFPVADVVAITGVQINLLISLGHLYGKAINRHTAKGLIGVALAGPTGMYLSSLAKTIPGVGTILGGMAQMLIAGTITYSLGLSAKHIFANDIELNSENLKEEIDKQDEEELNKKRDDLKAQIQKNKEAQKVIDFVARPKKFKQDVRFHFSVENYNRVKLRITDAESILIFEKGINPNFKSTNYHGSNMKKGSYLAFLECDDLLPVCIKIVKG
jgi:uncharacterized protein (DUF697 family)